MTGRDIERLVRSVIVERGLRFAILSVTASPIGWTIRIRAGTGGSFAFTIRAGRPLAMRGAIQKALEAECSA